MIEVLQDMGSQDGQGKQDDGLVNTARSQIVGSSSAHDAPFAQA